jgi:hypothetical protein
MTPGSVSRSSFQARLPLAPSDTEHLRQAVAHGALAELRAVLAAHPSQVVLNEGRRAVLSCILPTDLCTSFAQVRLAELNRDGR